MRPGRDLDAREAARRLRVAHVDKRGAVGRLHVRDVGDVSVDHDLATAGAIEVADPSQPSRALPVVRHGLSPRTLRATGVRGMLSGRLSVRNAGSGSRRAPRGVARVREPRDDHDDEQRLEQEALEVRVDADEREARKAHLVNGHLTPASCSAAMPLPARITASRPAIPLAPSADCRRHKLRSRGSSRVVKRIASQRVPARQPATPTPPGDSPRGVQRYVTQAERPTPREAAGLDAAAPRGTDAARGRPRRCRGRDRARWGSAM